MIAESPDGHIMSWNPAAESTFGHRSDEICGESASRLVPGDRVEAENAIRQRVRGGESLPRRETVRLHKDGTRIDVQVTTRPIKDAAGQVLGVLSIFRDIRAQKSASGARPTAPDHEAAVAERTAHLQRTITELEGVTYSVAHDLRAPLRTIQGFLQIILADVGEKLGEHETHLLQRTINAANRLERLIQDTLTYARVSRQQITLTTLNLEQVVRRVIAERPEWQAPTVDIRIEAPLASVVADEAALTQCVTQLLDNAVKFVAPDQQPRIRIRSEVEQGHARLWIEDNGIGIAKAAQARLFGVLQRLHDDKRYSGSGIGLAIVRKSIERMGGSVHVDSEPGRGSRFGLQLATPARE